MKVTPSGNNVYKNCRNLIRVDIFMKDCLDSGIEKGADLKILRVHNGLLYDRSHPKNVYDDPYRLSKYPLFVNEVESARDFANHLILYTVSFAPSPKAIFRRNTFGTPITLISLLNKAFDIPFYPNVEESLIPRQEVPDLTPLRKLEAWTIDYWFIIRRDSRRDTISINMLVGNEATDTCIWIKRWIDNLQLKSDLLEARNTLQHRSKDLKLVKVKGHSGIELNEQVDKLAKEAGNIDSCFSNRFNYSHPNFSVLFSFLQHPIE
ncbi:hypothetical protein C1646_752164 [Rhizophagus diaphanus]|nr:hypothetical protein C1646_752164 [Rhizophagus diaphanus] [Rhizophagus sp. MUCL 43196]